MVEGKTHTKKNCSCRDYQHLTTLITLRNVVEIIYLFSVEAKLLRANNSKSLHSETCSFSILYPTYSINTKINSYQNQMSIITLLVLFSLFYIYLFYLLIYPR